MDKISGDINNAVNKFERMENNSSVMAYNSGITAQNI